jgi:hypothetical protein
MKDSRGIDRGQCVVEGCQCSEYTTKNAGVNRCVNCGHPPVRHAQKFSANRDSFATSRSTPTLHLRSESDSSDGIDDDDDELEDMDEECDGEGYSPDSICIYPGCRRLKYSDPYRVHDFCGKAHATMYYSTSEAQIGLNTASTLGPGVKLCKLDGCRRPVLEDYEFCGRSHGLQYMQTSQSLGHPSLSPMTQQTRAASPVSPREKCKMPSCTRKRYSVEGGIEDFCGQTCAKAAQQQGIQVQSLWLVSPGSQEYTNVSTHFFNTWKKGAVPPKDCIKGIVCIDVYQVKKNYSQYVKQTLSGQPNEAMYYHGTVLRCNVASTLRFCGDSKCGACGISQQGFLKSKIRSHVKFQRLGHAFYFSPNSSKCHEYSKGYGGCRAMMVCKVAQGKVYQASHDMSSITSPPKGHDSVAATPGQHRGMNYAELATYAEHSILPQYIIVYQYQGVNVLL